MWLPTTSHCADLYVVEAYGQNPEGDEGSETNPYTGSGGIQDAIGIASSGDTIHVAGGTYGRIVFPSYQSPPIDLTVKADNSWYGSGVPVIDGTGYSYLPGVLFDGGQTENTVLEGFLIRDWSGGTVSCGMRITYDPTTGLGSSPTIQGCTFENNCTNPIGHYGGAALQILQDCDPIIDSCHFEDNRIGCGSDTQVGYGGAIWIYGSSINETECTGTPPDPIVSNCTFVENTATNNTSWGAGGAIAITCGAGTILGCEFYANEAAKSGGAFYGKLCYGTLIESCLFAQGEYDRPNVADGGGAIYLVGIAAEDSAERVHIIRNTFEDNIANDAGSAIYVLDKSEG